ncbi:MAG TPA: hypothetical protein VFR84_03775 [Candidatus Angelobacter sp.]|nr:hypothetical protein [Candidatus Angelobacter sp.]
MFDLIAIAVVGSLLLFAAYVALQFSGKFPRRTIQDVTPFLRTAEAHEFESLLDPAQEVNLRLRLSPAEFASWQRKRLLLAREYLLRMSHNSLVLIEWGNMESFGQEAGDSELARQKKLLAQEMVHAATEFRLYSMFALFKLRLWLLLPSRFFLLKTPSLPRLRNLFGINAMSAYERLKNTAGSLGVVYSNDVQQDLLARL